MKKKKRFLIVLAIVVCVVAAVCIYFFVAGESSDECSHKWSKWKTQTPTTCTTDGLKTRTCSLCGEIEKKEISALGHTESDWIVDEDVTCTTSGSKHKECRVCGTTLETEVVKALGHSGGEATCTQKAICSVCGEEYGKLDSNNHDFGAWIKEEPATCTVAGVKAHKTCNLCGKHFDSNGNKIKDINVKALGHDEISHEGKTPTCTEIGWEAYVTCSRCDYTTYKEKDALGHTESDWIVDDDSSCLTGGTKHKECTECGEVLETAEIPVGSHIASDWITDTEATCTEAGSKHKECTFCGKTLETEEIEVLDHTPSDWIVDIEATCAKVGSKHKECTVCGKTLETEEITKIAHSYTTSMVTEPTCTAQGYTTHTCSCGDSYVDTYVNALKHTPSDWIVDTEATCAKVGSKHKECTVCGKILKTESIEKIAHNYTSTVVTEPTCTAQGYTTHTCSCGDSYVDTYVDALGHDTISHDVQAPTCTEIGWYAYETCSRCDYSTYKEIAPLGHTPSDWIVDTEATCTNVGSKHKECSVCGKILKTVTISAGHNYVDGICSRCGAEKTTEGLTYSYSSSTKSYTVTGYTGTDTEVYIPSVYNNGTNGKHAVTSIGKSAFSGCTGLTSVTISDSVTNIGSSAFSGCTGLTSVTIPNGVTSIGDAAFSYCKSLTSITVEEGNTKYHSSGNCLIETKSKTLILGCHTSKIPNDGSVTSIGNYAFRGCTGLTSVTIPDSVTSIGFSAFENCTDLTSVTIGSGVTSIGDDVFYHCTGLKSVTIPNSVTSLGHNAFNGCTGLTSVTIPDSVTSIGQCAFNGCTGLTSVTIPDSVTSIRNDTFRNCTGLKSVTIGSGVTSIGDDAFYHCTGLTSVTIPDSVTSIESYAFDNCTSLTRIAFKDTTTWYRTTSYLDWKKKTGGTKESVTSASTNATYFTSTYSDYYWYKI